MGGNVSIDGPKCKPCDASMTEIIDEMSHSIEKVRTRLDAPRAAEHAPAPTTTDAPSSPNATPSSPRSAPNVSPSSSSAHIAIPSCGAANPSMQAASKACDVHAGYVWCEDKERCIRPWLERCREHNKTNDQQQFYRHDSTNDGVHACRAKLDDGIFRLENGCGPRIADDFDRVARGMCMIDPMMAERCGTRFSELASCVLDQGCPRHDGSTFTLNALPCQRELILLSDCTHNR